MNNHTGKQKIIFKKRLDTELSSSKSTCRIIMYREGVKPLTKSIQL